MVMTNGRMTPVIKNPMIDNIIGSKQIVLADVLDDLNMPAGSIWPANPAWASPSPVCH
jgi:hypothetical protein